MKNFNYNYDGNLREAIAYPLLLIILLWAIFLLDHTLHLDLYKLGVKPQTWEGLKGIFLMPFIHSQKDLTHIANNSIPTFVLLSSLIYYYRKIAFWVVLTIWLGSSFLVWNIAENTGSYHIGISGVIYGLFSFLFVSGIFRKHTPMWAISLFVIFLYGSLIWGIFPTEKPISWEGHLFGFIVGILVAIATRNKGPKAKKYRYEIEKEMGIDPPDFEGMYKENLRIAREKEEQIQAMRAEIVRLQVENEKGENDNQQNEVTTQYIYHYKPNSPEEDKDQHK